MRIAHVSFQMLLCLALALLIAPPLTLAQHPSASGAVSTGGMIGANAIDLEISVRDVHGNVIETPAVVRLTSAVRKYNGVSSSENLTPARFHQVMMGEYQIEVICPGFQKTEQTFLVDIGYSGMPVYVYLVPESNSTKVAAANPAVMLAPQFRSDLERGIEALRKRHYSAAQKTFTKLLPKTHDNPDVLYNLGLAELGLQHDDLARSDFQRALATDPNHELALVSLARMELRSGSPATAVPLLEKAASPEATSWRTDFELATADLKLNRLSEAESAASRAVRLARNQDAAPTYLLGQIQYAAGKRSYARLTWESMQKTFLSDPLTARASKNLAQLDFTKDSASPSSTASDPGPAVSDPATAVADTEHPWAPPDIDDVVPDVASGVSCNTETVLDQALRRIKWQLLDLEKFTATERVELQEIDSYGWPGPVKSREFSYIVLVYPMKKDSMYFEESRNGSTGTSGMDDAIISTNLNALGINILQPYYRDRFNYSCEGLAHVRGLAAWQVHFVEKADIHDGVRTWKTNRKTYDIPIKGRIWISSLNFSVLRIETDLREPIKDLQLTRDHLLVDYGPVDFVSQSKQLWLPWSADMFTEFHGKRYHDKHSLTDYLLFAIDTAEKVGKPPEEPPH
jgi:tetratricopeptide (TPR) repeat protein